MKKIKVLLLNPPSRHGTAIVRDTLYGCWCKGRANYMWPPLGLAQLGGVLEADFDVSLLDAMALRYTLKRTIDHIKRLKPDYLVMNTATITFSDDMYVLKKIKKHFSMTSVLVGTHVTAMPKPTLKEDVVDYIILGEPDFALRDFLVALEQKKDINKIKGVGYSKGKKIILNGVADPIENLDELPFAARHLIPNADYFNPLAKRLPYTTMMSSRGCPYNCIFCSSVILYGRKFRPRSAKNVVDEMEEVVKKYKIKEVLFRDETLTFNKERTKEICKEIIRRKLDITWITNTRVDCVDEEILRWLKKAGCHMLKMGVESGSQKILNNLRKGTKVEQIRKTFKLCKKVGISTVAHMMFGSPGETTETIKETIRFVKEIDPDYASFNITTPYPGTPLWDSIKDNLDITEDFSGYDIEKTLESADFNELFCGIKKKKLQKLYNKAYNSFYFRPSYLARRMLKQSSYTDFARAFKAGMHLTKFSIKNMLRK